MRAAACVAWGALAVALSCCAWPFLSASLWCAQRGLRLMAEDERAAEPQRATLPPATGIDVSTYSSIPQ